MPEEEMKEDTACGPDGCEKGAACEAEGCDGSSECADVKAEAEAAETAAKADEPKASKKKERDLGWTKKSKEKKNEADAEKAKLEAAAAEANDKYARLFAEFDNFRKRTEKEKSSMFAMGAKDTIEKILPVLDTLEKGLEGVPEEKKDDPFVVGMDKVHKLFLQNLENMGVTPIEAVGKEFDPELHNAVMHVDDENVGENIVVEEFQKGYKYRDSVVRFSMVKVAN